MHDRKKSGNLRMKGSQVRPFAEHMLQLGMWTLSQMRHRVLNTAVIYMLAI